MRFNQKILRFIPALIYFGLIWYFSSRQLNIDITKTDKLIHIIEYAIMGFLLSFGFNLNNNNFIKLGKYCFLVAAISGAADELHQCYVPWRCGSWTDFMADIIGCAIGILAWLALAKLYKKFRFML